MIFVFVFVSTFLIDQGIKHWVVDRAYEIHQKQATHTTTNIPEAALVGTILSTGKYINIELYLNRGVAFSMFSFLGPYMKWIQGSLVLFLLFIVFKEKYFQRYAVPAGLLMGGALGNVYDRFIHEGVVDYIFWHYGFNYPVFNYADVVIDVAFVMIVILLLRAKKSEVS